MVSKRNCGNRPGHFTEDAILEKRLVFDNALVTGKYTIYVMIELQAFYDRQLSKIGLIVQESVVAETKPIQLITKMLPTIEHHMSTAF